MWNSTSIGSALSIRPWFIQFWITAAAWSVRCLLVSIMLLMTGAPRIISAVKMRERSGCSNENIILRWIRSPSTLRGPKASSLKPNTTIQSVRMSCSTWRYSASLLSM
ncbi:hypothetical protein FQZ97_692940 [compost metagenome]